MSDIKKQPISRITGPGKSKSVDVDHPILPHTGLLRLPQVLKFIPVSPSQFWAGVKSGQYPASKKLSARVTVWTAESIRAYLERVSAQD
ncbi:hypothetical protein CHU94_08985 [Rhodoferax sp. TH121]|uniref:helix-turn-helix transcriptional regulator n=1 Tax=Rhodoferax sp. TH121 TaxID=2022803 RepID=UPI000B97C238|nr:AlpA family phage regulatory protein [Rhodoferax sp. TH121]OYQ41461.1 hypothetical protein CHU94_08985 [Rhodoferax sp. TH121]